MDRRIAVVFVHGVEIADAGFADTAIARLKAAFAKRVGGSGEPTDSLVVRTVFWAPVLDQQLQQLIERAFEPRASDVFAELTRLASGVNNGSQVALLSLILRGGIRWLPRAAGVHYAALRWMVTHFAGQAIGYQITPQDRHVYDAIHAVFATTLRELATAAGPEAPLCVIAHSLGTVFSSNYFYDLQTERTTGRSLVPRPVRERMHDTALEWGDTLTLLYTLGSPLALWSLRYPDFGVPIRVPAPDLPCRYPVLANAGEWINFHDPDDMIAYPLRRLSPLYAERVTEDRAVSVGPFWVRWNPLAHPWYWNDDVVIDPIATRLANVWNRLQSQ
jgi:hypothetical protein